MPPTGLRGTGPVNPRDYTGRLFAQQQKAIMDKARETRDIDYEIRQARKQGYDEGYSEAINFIREHYDLVEIEYDEDTNIFSQDEYN